ncbi:MAG: hypothetical protein M0P27_10435, partial [Bacteroidales bacterium]|nr:hypothetical protein [Bacteroidales bacterium]
MRLSIFFTAIFFILGACTEKSQNAFTLTGKINGLDGENIYLLYYPDYSDYTTNINQRIDTTVIV